MFLRWTLFVLFGLAGGVGAVVVIGSCLPKGHRAFRTTSVAAPPEAVFARITDFRGATTWRSGLKSLEIAGGAVGVGTVFTETSSQGAIPFRIEIWEPGRRLVTRIADPSLPFGGTWTYELAPTAGGTSITITEDGEVSNPIFRFMSRFVFSQTATIERYQADLRKSFGG